MYTFKYCSLQTFAPAKFPIGERINVGDEQCFYSDNVRCRAVIYQQLCFWVLSVRHNLRIKLGELITKETYEEYYWWIANECDCRGQLSLISPTIPPCALVDILSQVHLTNKTVHLLKQTKKHFLRITSKKKTA